MGQDHDSNRAEKAECGMARYDPATGEREKRPVESYPSHIPGKKGTQQPDALDSLGYPELR